MATTEPPATDQETDEEIDVEALLADPDEQHEAEHGKVEIEHGVAAAARPAQPIGASCSREFHALRKSGRRSLSQITLVIIHCTQSDSARGSAAWFANPKSQGSAHLVLDDLECYRSLDDEDIPWGAPGTNKNGFHIEHVGFAEWTRQQWMAHEDTLKRGAHKAAVHAKKFGIPTRVLSADDLKRGRKGFATHATVSQAFHGTHHDPGSNFPLDHYMQLVKNYSDDL